MNRPGVLNNPKKDNIIKLRWIVIIFISCFLLAGKFGVIKFFGIDSLIFLFLVSNFLLYFLPEKYFASFSFDYFVIVLDTAFIVFGIYLSGAGNISFFVVFFLVVILSAFLGRVRELAIITITLGCIYVWFAISFQVSILSWGEMLSIYLRIPFLLAIAIFNNYLVKRVKSQSLRQKALREDKKNLEKILAITRTLLGTLETKEIVAGMINEVAGIMGANRCSVILLDRKKNRGKILFSCEEVKPENMEIDLGNYPEIEKVLETGELVSVNNIKKDSLMHGVRSKIPNILEQSIMALPIIIDADVMGTLFLRVARTGKGFSERDENFCQVVANVTATALRNASLFEDMKEESGKRNEALKLLEEKNQELIKTKDYLENLITSSADAIVTTDNYGRITFFSPGAEEIFGYKSREVMGHRSSRYFAEGRKDFRSIARKIRDKKRIQSHETVLTTKRGVRVFASISAALLNDGTGRPVGTVAIIKDITQRVELEREIRAKAQLIRVINEVNNSFTTTLELEEVCRIVGAEMPKLIHFDEAGLSLLESPDQEYVFFPLKNMEMDSFNPYAEYGHASLVKSILNQKELVLNADLTKGTRFREELELKGRQIYSYILLPLIAEKGVMGLLYFGSTIPNFFSGKDADVARQIGGQIAIAIENAILHKKIKKQSVTDGLTGLFNHRYFHQHLEEEMKGSVSENSTLSLLFFDLDFFKQFNDINGHLLGDKALYEVGRILVSCKGKDDVAARYGGEEFALICPDTDMERSEEVAVKILEEINAFPFQKKSGNAVQSQLTISVGIACYPRDGTDRESLISAADWALFIAKKRGRNQLQHFKKEDNKERVGAHTDYSGVQT